MKPDLFNSNIMPFALPALLGFAACFQLIIFGYPLGHDWVFELVRIVEYHEALATGQVLPYWGGDLYRGFGSPIFIFYAPMYTACSALLMFTGLSVTTAAIAVLVFFSVLAATGMAGLTRELLGKDTSGATSAALVASAAYVLMPYFLADMLIRNASAEFVALCLAPFPLWGLALIWRGNSRGLPLLAISFALVILAHNLTGLLMAVALLLVILFLFLPQGQVGKLFSSVAAMLVSLGLSCWFWLPALGLKKYVRIDEMLQGKFDFHDNFSSFGEMFSYDGLFAIGWFLPSIMVISAVVLVLGKRRLLLSALFGLALVFMFLQTAASSIVWDSIPFLPLFQFPWRMMGPLALVTALMTGLLFHRYLSRLPVTAVIVVFFITANAVPLLRQYQPLTEGNHQFISATLNARGIRQRGLAATVLNEYLPRTADKCLSDKAPLGAVVVPSGSSINSVSNVKASNTRIYLEAETDTQAEIQLARWYFPGWHATLNGVDHPVLMTDSGAIRVSIPSGRHQLEVWLAQPRLRFWGIITSIVSFSLFMLLFVFDKRLSGYSTRVG